MKTCVAIVLDESGSMGVRRNDTIGGYNTFLEDQKQLKADDARFYLVKFNSVVSVVYAGLPLESAPPLDQKTYIPGGATALYDAVAEAVRLVERSKAEEDRVVCVIMTDGEENSSKETTKQQIAELIKNKQDSGKWTFLYIGENPEKWAKETSTFSGNVMAFDHSNVKFGFGSAGAAVQQLRCQPMAQMQSLFSAKK